MHSVDFWWKRAAAQSPRQRSRSTDVDRYTEVLAMTRLSLAAWSATRRSMSSGASSGSSHRRSLSA
eukprot:5580342-Alexandrium_andersonii.AAC.1